MALHVEMSFFIFVCSDCKTSLLELHYRLYMYVILHKDISMLEVLTSFDHVVFFVYFLFLFLFSA